MRGGQEERGLSGDNVRGRSRAVESEGLMGSLTFKAAMSPFPHLLPRRQTLFLGHAGGWQASSPHNKNVSQVGPARGPALHCWSEGSRTPLGSLSLG